MSYFQAIINDEVQRDTLLSHLRQSFSGDFRKGTQLRNTVICLVGTGGTGKTTLLDVITSVFRNHGKKVTYLWSLRDELKDGRHVIRRNSDDLFDVYIHDGILNDRELKIMTATDVTCVAVCTHTLHMDHGLDRRVTFVELTSHFDNNPIFNKETACRELLTEMMK